MSVHIPMVTQYYDDVIMTSLLTRSFHADTEDFQIFATHPLNTKQET